MVALSDTDFSTILQLRNQSIYLENNKLIKNYVTRDEKQMYSYMGLEGYKYKVRVISGEV